MLQVAVDVASSDSTLVLRANASGVVVPGFLKVYDGGKKDREEAAEGEGEGGGSAPAGSLSSLSALQQGARATVQEVKQRRQQRKMLSLH